MIDEEYVNERLEAIKLRFPALMLEPFLLTDDALTMSIKEAYLAVPKKCIYINRIVEFLAIHLILDDLRLNNNLTEDGGEQINDVKSIKVVGDINVAYRDKNSDEVNRMYGGSEYGLRALELMRKCAKLNVGFILPKCGK